MMSHRKRFAVLAACAALACAAGPLRASQQTPPSDAFTLAQSPARPIYAQDEPRKPLMHLLDQAGVAGTLDEYGINVGGWIEGSWTYNFGDPANHYNITRGFDLEDQDPTLNQLSVFVERSITASSDNFDLGGRMEWMWGGDARFIHANGLFDYDGFNDGPDEQFDLVQLYMTANLPVGNGIMVKGGKFVTPFGVETINPLESPFYSHSVMFNYGRPWTLTGVEATYAIDSNWSVTGGVVRGWDQALEDNNDMVSFLAQLGYTSEKLDFIASVLTGPEQFNNDSKYRALVNAALVWRENEKLTLKAEASYGWEPDVPFQGFNNTIVQNDCIWWGATGYVSYKVCDYATLNGRIEYFDDKDGSRRLGTEVTEATIGMTIRPWVNDTYGSGLILRPELRWDYATDLIFDGGDDHNQFTFAMDVIYAF
jgi:hypothetical protein